MVMNLILVWMVPRCHWQCNEYVIPKSIRRLGKDLGYKNWDILTRAYYLHPALGLGPMTTVDLPPCHEAAGVPGMWLAPKVTARFGRMGLGGPSTAVYAHDPCHVAADMQWRLIGSYGHGAARLEDMEADPGNVLSGHNRD